MVKDPDDIFQRIDQLHIEMEGLFHRLFNPRYSLRAIGEAKWEPYTDIYEDEERIVIKMEVAGLKKDDFSVTIQGRELSIKGIRKEPPSKTAKYHQMEINYGNFERVFLLPKEIDEKKIKAQYEDGFLYISISKKD